MPDTDDRPTAYSRVPQQVRDIFDAVREKHHPSLSLAIIDVLFAPGVLKLGGEDVAARAKIAPPEATAREDIHAWVLVNPDWFAANDPRQATIDDVECKVRTLVMMRVFDKVLCGLAWDGEKSKLKRQPGVIVHKAIWMRYGPLPGTMEDELAGVALARAEQGLGPWEPLSERPEAVPDLKLEGDDSTEAQETAPTSSESAPEEDDGAEGCEEDVSALGTSQSLGREVDPDDPWGAKKQLGK